MWDFFETVRHRHSIRKYQPDMAVEPEKLSAILEMACAAPSAGDLQAYRIIVVRDLADRQMLVNSCHQQNFIAEAPICLVFCADPARSESVFSERGARLYALQDATIAATYAQLAIVAAGMGSTWIGYFEEDKIREILKLESGLVPVALLSLGYPAELPEPSSRRRLDEVVAWR
ncbi:MAG: nitroreductase family protein [Candidatus Competibacteraceae bacterium]|nr:nitroreductase family protein [Candidatus Competibacteraceae bacterium]MBK7983825.1 nitroreductase family protein [Candidatus Competibacteraceae bacterium]MBK8897634.1 nitroreductase family protein [Candidatus Competibacteraceae bacterium]MBK8963778.1 nitroreductase family protein [Candidatus Competibacteraceae bacterium]MBK9950670.1 nitroreductase family protein [Candidatus Competibacteraceae bacterium]